MSARCYDGCDAAVEVFPAWKSCGKPVKIEKDKPVRCAEHPIRQIWP